MDGKQARRTGNSSPLGLLFDHGCDAFSVGMVTLMIAKMIQIGNNYIILLALLASTMAFYFATLEEYYTGGLFLGPGNGITDASIILIGLFVYCGVFGTDIFTRNIVFTLNGVEHSYRFGHVFAVAVLIQQTCAVLYKYSPSFNSL